MTFSPEWDRLYGSGDARISVWPWSDLVSFVMRYARPAAGAPWRVLELGCGAGPNVPFFLHLGALYHAVEGAAVMVEQVRERWPELEARVVCGDFTRALPFAGPFDLVVDRGSLSCNPEAGIRSCLREVLRTLAPTGTFLGLDWPSSVHPEATRGVPGPDRHTRTGFSSGLFAGVGNVHFSDQAHLLELFEGFEVTLLEHRNIIRTLPDAEGGRAHWSLVARPAAGAAR